VRVRISFYVYETAAAAAARSIIATHMMGRVLPLLLLPGSFV
jgi:hypothetical protein